MLSRRYRFVMRLYMAAAALLVALLVFAGGASAAWPTGAEFVSGSSALGLQGTFGTSEVSVSADGKFAVFSSTSSDFDDTVAPAGGIFRKNLLNDSAPIEVVVPYPTTKPHCGPSRPSISGNGRYIAFSSGVDGLVAADNNDRQDVFVRDMSKAIGSADAFELISAVDSGTAGASYSLPFESDFDPPVPDNPETPENDPIPAGPSYGNECLYGANLTENVGNAISNDGTKVVFTNRAFTDLDSPTAGNGTAPGQLWVRDRVKNETTLHTVVSEVIETPYIGAEPGAIGEPLADPREFHDNSGFPNPEAYQTVEPRVNISGDGSTIAWSGVWARSLVKPQASENWDFSETGGPYGTTRQLFWKRIADGPSAKVRRVSGIADLDDPLCDEDANWIELNSDEEPINATEAACRGPLRANEGEQCTALAAPQLTYDGYKVFFTTCAELRGDQFTNIPEEDVMVTSMAPGVSRKAGTKQLTYSIENTPAEPRIASFAASDDGNRVAVVTNRSDFSGVSAISFTGTPVPVGNQRRRMFVIDGGCDAEVHNGTIQWIARPSSGDLTKNGVPASITDGEFGFDADGNVAGFISNATNLVTGHNGEDQALSVTDSTAGCADTMDPTISISAPADGSTVSDENVTLRYTVSDNSGDATCDLADGSSQPLDVGQNTITVTCEDATGNDVSASVDVTLEDVTGPTVVISSPANGSTTGLSPTLNYTATDNSGETPDCDLVNGSTLGPYTAGAQSVTVTCEDASNNVGTATSNFTAAAGDTTAPTVTITSPTGGATTSPSPTLTFTVNDAVDPSPDCDKVSGSTLGPLSNGANSVTVSCEDASNNVGTATVNFTVDALAPVVTITSPANGSTTGASPTLTFTAIDAVDATPNCNRTNNSTLGPLSAGANTVTVTCTDDVGNSGSATSNFTVQLPTPPPVDTTPPPPVASLALLKPTIKGTAAAIPVQANIAGALAATGTAKLPKGKKMTVQKAGAGSASATPGATTTINFKLSAAAKKFLAKKKKLSVIVTVTYTPSSGAPITQSLKLNFKAAKKKK